MKERMDEEDKIAYMNNNPIEDNVDTRNLFQLSETN